MCRKAEAIFDILYSERARVLKAKFTTRYSRLSGMFGTIDGEGFRAAVRHIQSRLDAVSQEIGSTMFPAGELRSILSRILPEDASALQFQLIGGGLSRDFDESLRSLYSRHVAIYSERGPSESGFDDDVWKAFRGAFEAHHLTTVLTPKKITAPDYEYEFARAWRNGRWNVFEPVSFDLSDGGTILDKANGWLGRATTLHASSEEHNIYLLPGSPHRDGLETAFNRAQNILRSSPDVKLVPEHHAESFAALLAKEMAEHGALPKL